MNKPYLSVILPAYNEELRLDNCLRRLTRYLWDYTNYLFEIVVVVNGSTDTTQDIALHWRDYWPQVRVISIPEPGKGRAVKTGMLQATGTYRYMADVDLATPPDQIARFLLSAQAGQDVVIGQRLPQDIGPGRALSHQVWKLLTSPFVPGIHDSQCGFKMFHEDAARKIFAASHLNGYAFDVEVLMLARRYSLKIVQMPVPWKDMAGSKVRLFSDSVKMFRELWKLWQLPLITNYG
jgi:dolichyl-phosphate beta-glucosyltransferase